MQVADAECKRIVRCERSRDRCEQFAIESFCEQRDPSLTLIPRAIAPLPAPIAEGRIPDSVMRDNNGILENGLADPRLSTLRRVLDAIGGDLRDVSVRPAPTVSARTVLERRATGRERIETAGLGISDPSARLDRKERAGIDVLVERSARSAT